MARKLIYEEVRKFFNDNHCILLSKEIGSEVKLDYICACGNKYSHRYREFKKGRRCPQCSLKKKHGFKLTETYKKTTQCYQKLIPRTIKSQYSNNLVKELKLGYTKEEFYHHISSFENIENPWDIDHIIPIKAFTEHGIIGDEYFYVINALENLRPLCRTKNNQKGDSYNPKVLIKYLIKYGISPKQNPYNINFQDID